MEIDIDQVKLLLKNMTAKDAAKKLGVSRSKLFKIMKENNTSIREIKKSQKPPDQTIIDLYKTNNLEKTSKLSGTNKHYVVEVLKRNNIARNYTKTDNLDIKKVKAYFEEHTLGECGIKFGFSQDQIKWFLRKHNVDTTKHEGKPKKKININELINYYQSHNIEECSKHFNCSPSLISMKLKNNNVDTSIHKHKLSCEAKNKISKSNKKR